MSGGNGAANIDRTDTLEALMRAAVDAIVVIDRRGIVLQFNGAACRLFDYDEVDVIGHNVSMLMGAYDAAHHDAYIARYSETGVPRIVGLGREVVGKRRDGSEISLELSVGESKETAESIFVGILRDVSARKASEAHIERQEQKLRLLFDSAPSGAVELDANGRMTRVNRALARLIRRSGAELTGQLWDSWIHADDRQQMQSTIDALFRGEVEDAVCATRILRNDGELLTTNVSLASVHDDSDVHAVVALIEDRTESERLEAQTRMQQAELEHVARLSTLGEMVSGLAHEINQPLGAIATYAEASRRLMDRGDFDRVAETLTKIATQARRAGSVIEQMRGFVRKTERRLQTLDLESVLRDVIALAELDARTRRQSIDLSCEPDLWAESDEVLLQQVFLNLVRNAMEANEGRNQETVSIRGGSDGNEVCIEVQDAGHGIDLDNLDAIWEPFFSTKRTGMGLGLSISRSIVEELGGTIVALNNEAAGSTFRVCLPAADRPLTLDAREP